MTKNIIYKLFIWVAVLSISGCTTIKRSQSGLPEAYAGEVAKLSDTYERLDTGSANFYYVEAVDGRAMANAIVASNKASVGQGAVLTTVGTTRAVPAQPLTLHLIGQTHHSAPIGYMINSGKNYQVEGEISFTPKPDTDYLVKGKLTKEYSAVWLENLEGAVVSSVIEKNANGITTLQKNATPIIESQSDRQEISRELIFVNIAGGERARLVEAQLGKPDRITENKANVFVRRPDLVTYHYDGLGTITFVSRNGLYVDQVRPILANAADPEAAKAQLIQSEGATLQRLAKEFYRQSVTDTALLDAIANKIWTHNNSDNDFTIDGAAWLCKVLAKSGNPRYKTFLTTVAAQAGASKLRRHADDSAALLPSKQVEQYNPAQQPENTADSQL